MLSQLPSQRGKDGGHRLALFDVSDVKLPFMNISVKTHAFQPQYFFSADVRGGGEAGRPRTRRLQQRPNSTAGVFIRAFKPKYDRRSSVQAANEHSAVGILSDVPERCGAYVPYHMYFANVVTTVRSTAYLGSTQFWHKDQTVTVAK